jgi:hypothetical protein
MSEENSIDTTVQQFLDRKQDVPADKVARCFEALVPELNKLGFALWQFEFIPGRVVTGYPGGSYTEDSLFVKALGGHEFFNIDKTIRHPEQTAGIIAQLGK